MCGTLIINLIDQRDVDIDVCKKISIIITVTD